MKNRLEDHFVLRSVFKPPKNRSVSPLEALLVKFWPQTEKKGLQNGPLKVLDSRGGGPRLALQDAI